MCVCVHADTCTHMPDLHTHAHTQGYLFARGCVVCQVMPASRSSSAPWGACGNLSATILLFLPVTPAFPPNISRHSVSPSLLFLQISQVRADDSGLDRYVSVAMKRLAPGWWPFPVTSFAPPSPLFLIRVSGSSSRFLALCWCVLAGSPLLRRGGW